MTAPPRVLLVTGLSGAGRTTTLRMLEDLEWEAIDNLPVRLLERLLDASDVDGSLAIGLDTRTRGFDAGAIVELAKKLSARSDLVLGTLFLDCDDAELQRRYNETRRRHPMAGPELRGRPVAEAIGAERATTAPLKRWAEMVIDTTALAVPDLQRTIRERFGGASGEPLSLTISSFGFARGMPPLADLVFDMRFLANPHWNEALRPLTGRDAAVGEHIEADPAFAETFDRIAGLVEHLLPQYRAQGRGYLHVALGCTGGRHRSVYTAERLVARLREQGFSPTILHRDLDARAVDAIEGLPAA